MKFDPFKRQEVKLNVENKAPEGRLRLWASRRVSLFVASEGYEVLAGSGYEFDLQTQAEMIFRVEGEDGARAFIELPTRTVFEPSDGETFTNIDRKPMESGNVLEVTRALRLMRLEHQRMMAEIAAAKAPAADAEPEPEETEAKPTEGTDA